MLRIKNIFMNTKVEDVVREMISYYPVEKLPEYVAEYVRIKNEFFTEFAQEKISKMGAYNLEFSKLPGHNNFLINLCEQSDRGKEFRKMDYWELLSCSVSETVSNKFHCEEIITILIPKIISMNKSYMMNNLQIVSEPMLEDMFVDAMQVNLIHKDEIYHKVKLSNDSKLAELKQKGFLV